jgi:hypothetical protein
VSEGAGEAGATTPPRKKKRKKKAAHAVAQPPSAADERPVFARGFPDDPQLNRLVTAFDAGDYATVRARAHELVHATKNDEVRRAARELLRRIEPDRTATLLLGVAFALLAFLSWWHWSHPHGAGG